MIAVIEVIGVLIVLGVIVVMWRHAGNAMASLCLASAAGVVLASALAMAPANAGAAQPTMGFKDFKDFKASGATYYGPVTPLKLRSRQDRKFAEQLRGVSESPVNFA